MIEPQPPRDLVLPAQGSTTARAVQTMALRGLFETLKTLAPDPRGTEASVAAYRSLREVLVGFLPGNPHTISRMLDRPTVAAAVRCLRDGVGDPDLVQATIAAQGLFHLAVEGALHEPVRIEARVPELVHLDRRFRLVHDAAEPIGFARSEVDLDGERRSLVDLEPSSDLVPLEGRLCLVRAPEPASRLFASSAPLLDEASTEAFVRVLRDALRALAQVAPGRRAVLDRFLHAVLPRASSEGSTLPAPQALGIARVTVTSDVRSVLRELVSTTIEHPIHALREQDRLLARGDEAPSDGGYEGVPDRLSLLVQVSTEVAWASIAAAIRTRRDSRLPDLGEPDYSGLRERVGAAVAELVARGEPTEVGMGIVDELGRFLRAGAES